MGFIVYRLRLVLFLFYRFTSTLLDMGNTYYRPDEGIEKWASMRENTHQYFRWTRKTILWGFVSCVLIPAGLWWIIDRNFKWPEDTNGESHNPKFIRKGAISSSS